MLDESLTLARALGDRRWLSVVLGHYEVWLRQPGDAALPRAQLTERLDEALALAREVGDRYREVRALRGLFDLARDAGDLDRAEALGRQTLALCEAMGSGSGVTLMHTLLGALALARGEPAAARRRLDSALAGAIRSRDTGQIAWARWGLGLLAAAGGEPGRVRAHYRAAVALFRERGVLAELAQNLPTLAALALREGRPDRAVRLASAAESLCRERGWPLGPTKLGTDGQAECSWCLAQARLLLDPEAVAAAEAEGRVMTLEQALTDALGTLDAPDPVDTALSAPRRPAPGALSPRQTQVAALVARGLTNREIAAALLVTEHTAMRHVEHILSRLGLRNRAQITAWAVVHGLAEGVSAG
jgi:non-specific serine/threonine protein kinase